jgi:hypothetical protein
MEFSGSIQAIAIHPMTNQHTKDLSIEASSAMFVTGNGSHLLLVTGGPSLAIFSTPYPALDFR